MSTTKKILVIEDNRDVLDAIVSILQYTGYRSQGVTRFTERVFEQIKIESIGLLILDVMLSGKDGRELVRRIKNDQQTQNVPVLMISAYADMETSVIQAGADGFLQKPFGLDDLTQKVAHFVGENM